MSENKLSPEDDRIDHQIATQTFEQSQQGLHALGELPKLNWQQQLNGQQQLPEPHLDNQNIAEHPTLALFGNSVLSFILASFCSGAVYTILFYLNAWLTQHLEDIAGVNWVYLPAGLRLFLTLILGLSGALGIALASFAISLVSFYEGQWITCAGIGMASGFAPLLARFVAERGLDLNADLSGLNYPKLLQCILIYAALSSALHQYWFVLRDLPSAGTDHWVVMFIGDVLGSLLLIALIKTLRDWMGVRYTNKSLSA